MNDLDRWAEGLFSDNQSKHQALPRFRARRAYTTVVTYKGKKESIIFLAHDDAHAQKIAEHINGSDPSIIKFLNS